MSFAALLIHLKPTSNGPLPSWDEVWKTGEPSLRELRTALSASESTQQATQEGCIPSASLMPTLLLDENHQLHLRVTILGGKSGLPSIAPCLDVLTAYPFLCIGNHTYMTEAVDISHSAWAGLSTWADFLAPPYGETIKLSLGTPLILLPDADTAEEQTFHFPFPRPLFAALARRWQELGGPTLPVAYGDLLPLFSDGSIVLADYHLHSSQVPLSGKVWFGFRGWISYECRTSSSAVQTTLAALARFAFFAGVGAFTEFGMGATRITLG